MEEEKEFDKMDELLIEFSSVRKSIYEMIDEIEKISRNIKNMFPDTDKFDQRYRLIFQERVKALTELFKTLLDMRKEITKNIKDEIELRNKLKSKDVYDNIEDAINLSSIMEKIEELENKSKRQKDKIKKKTDNLLTVDDINIEYEEN